MLKGVVTGVVSATFVASMITFFYGTYLGRSSGVTGAVIGGTSALAYIILLIVLSFSALFFLIKIFRKKSLEY